MDLLEAIKAHPQFQSLPQSQQEIIAILATHFEDTIDLSIYLSPQELSQKLQIGSKAQWQDFLNLPPTKHYITRVLAENAEVAARKSFQALSTAAQHGDTQAARQVNDIANIFKQSENSQIVILHRIPRPQNQNQ